MTPSHTPLPGLQGPVRIPDLLAHRRVVTVEVKPPKGCDVGSALAEVAPIADRVDAVNITDSTLARMKISSIALAAIIQERFGVNTVFNFTARDRNLIGLQSELLGGWALGCRNLLALTGDAVAIGDHPEAKPVFEFNSVGLVKTVRTLNEGTDATGHPLEGKPHYGIGVAANPTAPKLESEIKRLAKKVEAGAEFVMTQPVYEPQSLHRFLDLVAPLGIPVLLGILPLKSFKLARFLDEKVPGVHIPTDLLARMNKGDPEAELAQGTQEAMAMLDAARDRVAGFHIMPAGHTGVVLALVDHLDRVGFRALPPPQ